MADTTFIDQETIIEADWANDVNSLVYAIFQGAQTQQEATNALPVATETNRGMLSAPDKVKLDNFTVIIVEEETTSITLELNDNYHYIKVNSATAVTVTVPPNSDEALPIGSFIFVEQAGAGGITFAPGTAVTLNTAKTLATDTQFAVVALIKKAANQWTVTGNLVTA